MTNRQRVGKVLEKVVRINEERKKRIQTNELNDYLLPIISKTPPPAQMGKQIKIKYITQIKSNPPTIAFFTNHPDLITENYQRFLENQVRKKFGFKGIPIKLVFKAK